MKSCNCPHKGKLDFLDHAPTCPVFISGIKNMRDQQITDLRQIAERIDKISERMGRLSVGGALIHKIANIRFCLMAEAIKIRSNLKSLKAPLNKALTPNQKPKSKEEKN